MSLLLANGAPLEQRDAFGGTAMASAGAGPYTPLTGTASSTLQGHTKWMTALAVLPDGRFASASADKTVRYRRREAEGGGEAHALWSQRRRGQPCSCTASRPGGKQRDERHLVLRAQPQRRAPPQGAA